METVHSSLRFFLKPYLKGEQKVFIVFLTDLVEKSKTNCIFFSTTNLNDPHIKTRNPEKYKVYMTFTECYKNSSILVLLHQLNKEEKMKTIKK